MFRLRGGENEPIFLLLGWRLEVVNRSVNLGRLRDESERQGCSEIEP